MPLSVLSRLRSVFRPSRLAQQSALSNGGRANPDLVAAMLAPLPKPRHTDLDANPYHQAALAARSGYIQ